MKAKGRTCRAIGFTATALLALAVFVTGCPSPDFPQCRDADDCASNGPEGNTLLACCDGQCQECCADQDCPQERPKCKDMRCVECSEDADCPVDKPYCDNEKCAYECEINADCNARGKPGMVCKENKCQACESDEECGDPSLACVDGRCVPACACQSDADCPEGKVCQDCACVEPSCEPQTIYFDFDRYDLRPGDRDILDQNAECLKQRPELIVSVEGHCDERGTEEYNIALGERRARTAKKYLQNLGISAERLRTISYGEGRPVCTQSYEDCYSRNRRVDFVAR